MIRTWVVAVLMIGTAGSAGAFQSGDTKKPDLIVPKAAGSLLDAYVPTGVNEVRFGTKIANIGSHELRLTKGTYYRTDRSYDAVQEYLENGALVKVVVGRYRYHDIHRHWHLDDFALYELRDASGTLRTGTKASFCLLDSEVHDASLPGWPSSPVYRSCGKKTQGISIGWRDHYHSGLFGQSLSLVGIPDGDYTLVVTTNPLGYIRETTTANNSSSVNLRIMTDGMGQRFATILP